MDFRIGVLIIGSLFWDEIYDRPRWRQEYLSLKEAVEVWVPIRYGRFSTKRRAYTMLFSSSAPNGQALVIPYSHRVRQPQDLINEAERLWKAEDNQINKITSPWGGCVALCVNEKRYSNEHAALLEIWEGRVKREADIYELFPQSPDEDRRLVNNNGVLDIWPTRLDGQALDFDFLLATANYPFNPVAPRPYPNAQAIAEAWLANPGELRYFTNNYTNNFRTFQDDAIMLALSRKGALT